MKHLITTTLITAAAGLAMQVLPALARADGTPSCGVPVCDIAKEVESMRELRQSDRFARIMDLDATAKRSTDVAVLRNIADFSIPLEKFLRDVKEDDWMIRSVTGMSADAYLGLAKYSPLAAENLASYYRQITGETNRYLVLTFWSEKIRDYEDSQSLLELLKLFHLMGAASRDAQDPDYLSRSAKTSEDAITAKLTQLYPYFEGVYDISVRCTGVKPAVQMPAYCQNGYINHLTVMDTLGNDGLQVSLLNSMSGTVLYDFTQTVLSNEGSSVDALGTPGGMLSQLHLDLNRESGTISGWIKNTDLLFNLEITGQRSFTSASVFDARKREIATLPCPASSIGRFYRGTLGDQRVQVTIRSIGTEQFGATLAFDSMPNQRLRFQSVRYFQKTGILVMVSNQPNGSRLKLTLFFRAPDAAGRVSAIGSAFSNLNGSVHEITLQEQAE